MKKIYISGPITIDPDGYMEHFKMAQMYLERLFPEAEIHNPALPENNPVFEKDDPVNWITVMQQDIMKVFECDMIYMLSGWEKSPGARIEYTVAEKYGLRFMFEDDPEEDIVTTYNM